MKKRTALLSAALLVPVLCLTACSKRSAHAAWGASASSSGTTAYQASLQPQRDRDGKIINRLQAPSNQTYYFSFDQSVVGSADYKAIAVQAEYLASHPSARVRLEGNTDDRGSREYNIGLGWRRDQAVKQRLLQLGVRGQQIVMISYGKEKPAVSGFSESQRQLNRRVHMVYEAY